MPDTISDAKRDRIAALLGKLGGLDSDISQVYRKRCWRSRPQGTMTTPR